MAVKKKAKESAVDKAAQDDSKSTEKEKSVDEGSTGTKAVDDMKTEPSVSEPPVSEESPLEKVAKVTPGKNVEKEKKKKSLMELRKAADGKKTRTEQVCRERMDSDAVSSPKRVSTNRDYESASSALMSDDGLGGVDLTKFDQVGIHEVEESGYELESDYKYIYCMLLHIAPNSQKKGVNVYWSKGQKGGGQPVSTSFDRILMFGDLSSATGDCFAIISESSRESSFLLSGLNENGSIGDCVLVIEPIFTSRTLGQNRDMPIVEVTKPLLWKALDVYIPLVKLTIPRDPCTKYFYVNGMQIVVQGITMAKAICGGRLCDRQDLPSRKKDCSCLHPGVAKQNYPIVLEMRLHVLRPKQAKKEILFSVNHYRSWRTTNMFVGNLGVSTKDSAFSDREYELRQTVVRNVRAVNKRGGWIICGWFRVGVEDSGPKTSESNEQVASASVSPHIVYMEPTNPVLREALRANKYSLPTTLDIVDSDDEEEE